MHGRAKPTRSAVLHAAALVACCVFYKGAAAQPGNVGEERDKITDSKRREIPMIIKLTPENVRAAPITLKSPARIVLVEGNVVLRRDGRVYPKPSAGDKLVRDDFLQLGDNSALVMDGAGSRVRVSAKDGRWFWINLVDSK